MTSAICIRHLEVNGDIRKDAFWLCLEKDVQHINIAELDIVPRSVKIAPQ